MSVVRTIIWIQTKLNVDKVESSQARVEIKTLLDVRFVMMAKRLNSTFLVLVELLHRGVEKYYQVVVVVQHKLHQHRRRDHL